MADIRYTLDEELNTDFANLQYNSISGGSVVTPAADQNGSLQIPKTLSREPITMPRSI